jgi:hypothetical protein
MVRCRARETLVPNRPERDVKMWVQYIEDMALMFGACLRQKFQSLCMSRLVCNYVVYFLF